MKPNKKVINKDMSETSQQFQAPQLMPSNHPHRPDYMFQIAARLVIAYQISMPQTTLVINKVNQHNTKRSVNMSH